MININRTSGSLRPLNSAQDSRQQSLQRLSSGNRINSAKDDAAGLSISTRLESQGGAQRAAIRNGLDGISRIQVEGGALESVTEDLQRIRELKTQQGSGILSEQDQSAIQSEIDQRVDSINTVVNGTQFNQRQVFEEGELNFQIGEEAANKITLTTQDLGRELDDIGISTAENFGLNEIEEALSQVSIRQSELGAVSNRLASNTQFLELKYENNQVANSRIINADIAKTASEKSKADIQMEVAMSVRSQANASSKLVLDLLK